MTRHLLDLPADIDKVRLLCGPRLDRGPRGDVVSGDPALCSCIGCLRAKVVLQAHHITQLEERVAWLEKEKLSDG